ncbi:SAV_2336 N-terminal domain-related protein [Streptomyces sp. NPDC002888]|uniref:SAV_2336 N-terminal domain-related protein n=1 Tax=Streptomyces sp. NPDC002888 TaxID=3364668 RepID=UPI0036C46399
MIEELLAAFAEDGTDVGVDEVADVLWLAARVAAAARTPRPEPPASEPLPAPGQRRPAAPAREPEAELFPRRSATKGDEAGRDGARGGVPLRVPRAAALHDPLDLMRSLRPLGRRAIGGPGDRLDEQATVEHSVEQMLPCPVLLPAESRWLDLALVVDTHHSMLLWTDLVDELRRALTSSGVFRDVRTWYLSGTVGAGTPGVAHRPGAPPRDPAEIADPSGHRLIVVVTDTVADGWRRGALHDVLHHWSGHNSVAVLNVLPERLWSRAAVRPVSLSLRADRPARPTRSWQRAAAPRRTRARHRLGPAPTAGTPPVVPVVSASPGSLARLARLVSGDAGRHRFACLRLDVRRADDIGTEAPTTGAAPDPLVAVERFRAGASPTAQRLAAYLAAVPLTLPVMSLVRHSLLPGSEHGHLAEVALGGLFEPWGTTGADVPPDDFTFDFLPGVRDALLGSQLRGDVAAVRELVRQSVWDHLDRGQGFGGEFTATRVGRGASGRRRVEADEQSFAERRPRETGQESGRTEADSPSGPPPSGLAGRLVRVSPLVSTGGDGGVGLLLTPQLVLTCLQAPAGGDPGYVVSVDGRDIYAWVVWSEGRTPGAGLLLTQEDVLDADTWAQRAPERLRWASQGDSAPVPVDIDAFSEVGDPVRLGAEAHPAGNVLKVDITAPHPTTGWPQLAGAPLSRDGEFSGLVVGRDRTGTRLVALSASRLLGEGELQQALAQAGHTPYARESAGPLCLAVEIVRRDGSTTDGGQSEHEVADLLVELMAGAEVDGTVTRQGGPGRPDLLVELDAPFALPGLGRLLTELSDRLAQYGDRTGTGMTLVMAVAQESEGRDATALLRHPGFRDRHAGMVLWPGEGPLLLAVSPLVHLRMIEALDPESGSRWFIPIGGLGPGAPIGWFRTSDCVRFGRALAVLTDADPVPVRCGFGADGTDGGGCVGRALPGYEACLEHVSAEERRRYLATLPSAVSVDFSGTTFSQALLAELLRALADPDLTLHPVLGRAIFDRAVFSDGCDFRGVEFFEEARFDRAVFAGPARFSGALFRGTVSFDRAVFSDQADFDTAACNSDASVCRAVFEGRASFAEARFSSTASFDHSRFRDAALWTRAHFGGAASFAQTVFEGLVDFSSAEFDGAVDIAGRRFAGGSETGLLAVGDTDEPAYLRRLIGSAQAVVFGFDGTLCRLFAGRGPEHMARDLAERLRARGLGALLPAGDAVDPYALLSDISRGYPGSDLVRELDERLTRQELRAVTTAYPIAYADPLLRSLSAIGTPLAVATHCSPRAVQAYLDSRALASVVGHVHGRSSSGEAFPPPSMLRAVSALGIAPAQALMIGATPADYRASREAGARFLGLARDDRASERLRAEGADAVVRSLEPVLAVIRDIASGRPPSD